MHAHRVVTGANWLVLVRGSVTESTSRPSTSDKARPDFVMDKSSVGELVEVRAAMGPQRSAFGL